MGKLLKWGVPTLIVLLLVSTVVFGLFFEKRFDEAHQRLADEYDMEYSKPRNNHGLFTSDIEVCFRPHNTTLTNGASFCATYAVQYGPVLWHGGLNLGWMSARITPRWPVEMDTALRSIFGQEPALQLALQARFFDQLYVLVETPKLSASDTQKFAMDAMKWHNWIDLKTGHYRTEGKWPSVDVEAPVNAQLRNLHFAGEFDYDSSKLWLGSMQLQLDQISVSNHGVNVFELHQAAYQVSSLNNSNVQLVDNDVSVKWQRLQVGQQIPTQGDVHVIVEGVNKQAMHQMQSMSRTLSGTADTDTIKTAMAALQQLTASGLKVRIEKLDISSDSIHARGKGEFVLPASTEADAVATAMNRIEGKLDWSLPLGLVDQWAGHDAIQQWLGDKRIRLEGNLVHFSLTMNKGEMHLGQWRVPLPGSASPETEVPTPEEQGFGDYVEPTEETSDESAI